MKARALLSSLLVAAWIATYPARLLADKTDNLYRHAVETFRQGDLEDAVGELEAILVKKPNYAPASILLGEAHFLISQQAEPKGDPASAVAELREALRLDSDEAYWHSALAGLLHRQGDEQEAARECSFAAQLSPDDSRLASGCGLKATDQPDKPYTISGKERDKSVTPPVPLYKPEPPYSEKARQVRLQGNVVLWIVVNAQGAVERAHVMRALGLGLDQNALSTVLTWQFQPATKDGEPGSSARHGSNLLPAL